MNDMRFVSLVSSVHKPSSLESSGHPIVAAGFDIVLV